MDGIPSNLTLWLALAPLFFATVSLIWNWQLVRKLRKQQAEQAKLREQNQRWQLIIDSVPGCISYTDASLRYRFVNQTYEKWFGVSREQLIGKSIREVIGEQAYCRAYNYIERALGGETVTYEAVLPYKNNQTRVVSARLVPDCDEQARVRGYYALITDITERSQAEQALQKVNQELQALIENYPAPICLLDQSGRYTRVNSATAKLLNLSPEQIVGYHIKDVVPTNLVKTFQTRFQHLLETQASQIVEDCFPTPEGEKIFQSVLFPVIGSEQEEDSSTKLGSIAIDITQQKQAQQQLQTELSERKKLETQLRYQASHDWLTGLPNRSWLIERLDILLKNNQQQASTHASQATQFAVLFIDLDRFKLINDTLGHDVGDELLKLVARRLQKSLRETDTIARIGGDEFIILLEENVEKKVALNVASRINQVLKQPVWLKGQELHLSTSIGITLGPADYTDYNQILRNADLAMYQAKNHSREYELATSDMGDSLTENLQIETELPKAIKEKAISVYYQPIVYLETGKIHGWEALARWEHPTLGSISPAKFIDIAEEMNLIVALDLLVLRQACYQLRQWQQIESQGDKFQVNINLSGKHFTNSTSVVEIDQILHEYGLSGKNLKVEITESALIENATIAKEILGQLQEQGITIILDDFGTGYSSLSYLHQFPIDAIKLDRSFVMAYGLNQKTNKIVKAMIQLARELEISVVAEGIETVEQAWFLLESDCRLGQGYYFSYPLDGNSATNLLKNN